MKKKVLLIIALFAMLLLLISCGISRSQLDKQISGETTKTDVKGLEVSYPEEWQANNSDNSVIIEYKDKDEWVAEEEITYIKETDDSADINESFSSFVSGALDSGSINVDGFSGNYIVTNKKVTDKDDEVTSYLAVFKVDRSIFTFSYSTSSKLFDISQAEKLLDLVNIASYKSPSIASYSLKDSEKMVDGMETSELQKSTELVRIYSNGYEETVEKDAWKITNPEKLSAPTTTVTVSVDDKEIDIDINDIAEVSKYTISLNTTAVGGLKISEIQETADLKRVYGNGYEETVEKGTWEITKPGKLMAPTTTVTVAVDDKEVEIVINNIGYKHYSEFPALTDFGSFSGIEPSETSNSGVFSYYNGIQDIPFIEYYDMYYQYPITSENRHFIEEYYKHIAKDGMKDETSSIAKNVKYFYYHEDQSDEVEFIMLTSDDTFRIYRITDESPL